MQRKTYHIGLWNYAREFFLAAEKLRGPDETMINIPTYYLYGHAIELALKALLFYTDSDGKELKTIGHNLTTALKKAMQKGLDEHLSDLDEAKRIVELINPYYQAKELEYIVQGFKRFPSILQMSTAAANLIYYVGKVIKIPPAQLNKANSAVAKKLPG
jgi:hypothetical protein